MDRVEFRGLQPACASLWVPPVKWPRFPSIILQADMEAQAQALAQRLRDWEVKEHERTTKMEAWRAQMQAEAEAKAEAAATRLEAALSRDVERILSKRESYETRVKEAEARCVPGCCVWSAARLPSFRLRSCPPITLVRVWPLNRAALWLVGRLLLLHLRIQPLPPFSCRRQRITPPSLFAPAVCPLPTRRRTEREAQEKEMLRKRAVARAAKQKKMRDALLRTRAEELAWIGKLSESAAKEDKVLADVRSAATRELHERTERELVGFYERVETLKRQRKREEYERMQRLVAAMEGEKKREAEEAEALRAAKDRQEHQKRVLMMKFEAERELEAMRMTSNFSGLQRLMAKANISRGDDEEEGAAGAGGAAKGGRKA